jgi:hypothetical protein
MNEAFLANLERTLRAFIRLVDKLEAEPDKERWAAELTEAQACLNEARDLAYRDLP